MRRPFLAVLALVIGAGPLLGQAAPARLSVRVPADAKLFVDDVAVPLTAGARSFNTPALEPGQRYSYILRVELAEDGKPVKLERKVYVRAGQTTEVNFGDREAILAAARSTTAAPSTAPPTTPPTPTPARAEGPRPQGEPPVPKVVSFKDGKVRWEETVFEFRPEKRTRTVKTPDGDKQEEYTVNVPVAKKVEQGVDAKKVKAVGVDGKEIDPATLPELLKEPTGVFLCYDGQAPDPFFTKFARTGAVFLLIPPDAFFGPPAVPGGPPPAIPGPKT